MRTSFAAITALLATPAAAHHDAVVTTSMLPFAGWLAVVAVAGLAAVRQMVRRRAIKRMIKGRQKPE